MGGEATAVTLDTTDSFLEGAFWWPGAIMGRARRFKFSSEASHRFERGVDFQSITDHLERMTRLIIDICGGQAGPLDDQVINLPERKPVSMRLDRCHRVLGVLVMRQEVEGDRKCGVVGQSGSVGLAFGGGRHIKKKNKRKKH